MNKAMRRFDSNWISAALITLFVVSIGLLAENHVRASALASGDEPLVCSGNPAEPKRLIVRFH